MMTNLEIEDLLADIPDSDKVCGNCAHWGGNANGGKQLGSQWEYKKGGGVTTFPLYTCIENAGEIEPEVGRGHFVIALGPDCNCQSHAGAWEPCDEYLEAHEDDVAYQRDPYAYNGVSRADFM